ncbi:EAL domain-containing protein [Pseudovibrio sp. Tun.PSC04-5.I4]|uniref:bifunctional diguanylate cyclase/phosphodiesterase n=1 Tax=Pseudovibrio sp. Tun.PSC04-5.I4 TaxID=1798213 RepID=UPI000885498B|nr:EAL domain-containing protein [Pseudovibrio sp. Tun.PSC04-5.I4]SDR37779.1 diguanylate cyclase (GGDEF) domain-containing protein [Pseudovibrio sp. Tun.PSC04-5.I4]
MAGHTSSKTPITNAVLGGTFGNTITRGKKFGARVTALLILSVVAAALAVGYLAFYWSTQRALDFEVEKEIRLVQSNLKVFRNGLANEAERIAISNKAYASVLSEETNILLDEDLTPTPSTRGDRDIFVILNKEMEALYTYRRDLPWHSEIYEGQLRSQLSQTLSELETKANTKKLEFRVPEPLRSHAPLSLSFRDIAMVDGAIGLVTVAAITPSTAPPKGMPAVAGYLLWVRSLDIRSIRSFEESTGLADMFISTNKPQADFQRVSIPLLRRNGETIANLSWKTTAASSAIYTDSAPYFMGAICAIILMTILILLRYIKMTDRILQNEADATHAALHDALSGLPNRTWFEVFAADVLRRDRQKQRTTGIVFLDLDHFKQINDSLGHSIGDEVIKLVAERLRAAINHEDRVARVSGDEFLIVLSHRSNIEEVIETCMYIEKMLSDPLHVEKHKILTTASMGVALSPSHGHDLTALLRRADIALYQAKKLGRGRYVLFEKEMEDTLQISREIEEDIKRALNANEFQNFYQPIMDSTGKKILAAEALIRWNHPKKGLLPPAAFLPVAEESMLINRIGEWVLESAISDGTSLDDVTMCVNISPSQLRHPEFPELVSKLLKKHQLEPARLELEVTEDVLINYSETVIEVIERLRNLGVKIALDDFGTGFSSLSYLRRDLFDKIKVDRSFINGAVTDDKAREILASTISLGLRLGMDVCVEGVEEEEQKELLLTMDCPMMQGFLFSRPIPLGKFRLWRDDLDEEHHQNPRKFRAKLAR